MESERKKQEKMLENMCAHPHIFKAEGVKNYGSNI